MDPSEHDAPLPLLSELAQFGEYLPITIFRNDWHGKVVDFLGPQGGPIEGIGTESLHNIHPNDMMSALEAIFSARGGDLGAKASWTARYKMANGEYQSFFCQITNCHEDPSVASTITVLSPVAPEESPQTGEDEGPQSGIGTLANAVPLPIFFFGPGGLLRFTNDAAQSVFGDRLDDVAAHGLAKLCRSEDSARIDETVNRLLAGAGREVTSFSTVDERFGHSPRHFEVHLHAPTLKERVVGLIATLIDVTSRVESESALRARAARDPLTNLVHRGEIENYLNVRLIDDPTSVGVLYIDLDGFKLINDKFGHEIGDDVLVAVADTLTNKARPGDVVGRLGGDEFIVVLGSTGEQETATFSTGLKHAIRNLGQMHENQLDCSIGSAAGMPGDIARDLIRRADHAMYEVKRRRSVSPLS